MLHIAQLYTHIDNKIKSVINNMHTQSKPCLEKFGIIKFELNPVTTDTKATKVFLKVKFQVSSERGKEIIFCLFSTLILISKNWL